MKKKEILNLLEENNFEEEQNLYLPSKGIVDIGRLGGMPIIRIPIGEPPVAGAATTVAKPIK